MTSNGQGRGARRAGASGLPAGRTSFIGRSRDIGEVGRLIGRSRLVTLTGPGGIGKTRLAIEATRHVARRFPGGVVFVELASLRDPELLLSTIGAAVGINASEGPSTVDALRDRLGSQAALLVLDNFEQIQSAASAVSDLLAACPAVRVAVTSRTPLHVAGEQEYSVQPLALPDAERGASTAAMGDVESVALFVARARAVRPDFAITDTNARAVVELCRRLDGLPLAIELAAARTKLLAPEALLDRLEHRLPALATGPADAPARQHTLRETIAWSYGLLAPIDQRIFACLGVFVGGFSLTAAESIVLEPNEAGRLDLLEIVGLLVDHSLVRSNDGVATEPRFAMLETIREFAVDQLTATEVEALRDRHLAYFVGVAEAEDAQSRGMDQAAWVRRLALDRDNFRAALAHASNSRDVERLLRLSGALGRRFWLASGDHNFSESRRWLEDGLALGAEAPPALRAKALLRLAWTIEGSPARMLAILKEALSEYERAGDEAGMIDALSGLGHVAIHTGDWEVAERSLGRGLDIARRIDVPRHVLVELLVALGLLGYQRQQHAIARAHLDEAVDVARASGDTWGIAFGLYHLGRLALFEGDAGGAESALTESAELARTLADTAQWAEAALVLSTAWISTRRLADARSLIGDVAMTTGDLTFWQELMTLEATAEWLNAAGAHVAALACLAAAARARREHEQTIEMDWEVARRRLLEGLQRDLPPVEFEAAWAAGAARDIANALQVGLRAMESVDLAATPQSSLAPPRRHDLSRRELEVLALVAGGRSDGEIAERLFISKKTASVHVAHIKNKLGAESRVEVALAGIRLGLMKPSPDDQGVATSR